MIAGDAQPIGAGAAGSHCTALLLPPAGSCFQAEPPPALLEVSVCACGCLNSREITVMWGKPKSKKQADPSGTFPGCELSALRGSEEKGCILGTLMDGGRS